VAYVLLAAWCAVVWFLSSRPDPGDTVGFWIDLPDYVLHGVEFAAGGFLAATALSHLPARVALPAAWAFCLVYGLLDEWHQSFVPGRDATLSDVLADAVGALLGVVALAWIARRAGAPGAWAFSPRSGGREGAPLE
jgi:VanZ family protein